MTLSAPENSSSSIGAIGVDRLQGTSENRQLGLSAYGWGAPAQGQLPNTPGNYPTCCTKQEMKMGYSSMYSLAATALIAAFSGNAIAASDPYELEWIEVAEDVWAGIRPDSPRLPVVGTSVIVIGKTSVLLFDAGAAPLQSERVLAKVEELTPLPVTHIVISHWHGDHHLGIYRILEKYSDAEVISHSFTAAAIAGAPMDYIKPQIKDGFLASKNIIKDMVKTKRFPNGSEINDALLAYYKRAYEDADLIDEQLRAFVVVLPTTTFDHELEIDLGDQTAELLHFGRGNTKGDVVLWLPDERVAASADIVVHPTPYGFGSYPRSWIGSLNDLKALNFEILIPGHGALQTDTAYIDLLIETMNLIWTQVEPLASNGSTLENVRAQVDFSSVEDQFTGGDALLENRFDSWFKLPIVEAAFNVATGIENEKLEKENDD
jgi:glyoxylase-like metal-dependent hydrolase (beta-lactamase superfamily II)